MKNISIHQKLVFFRDPGPGELQINIEQVVSRISLDLVRCFSYETGSDVSVGFSLEVSCLEDEDGLMVSVIAKTNAELTEFGKSLTEKAEKKNE
jgi:hypothetical protein